MLSFKTYGICCKGLSLFILLFFTIVSPAQQNNQLHINPPSTAATFPLVTAGSTASIYYDQQDAKVVQIAAKAFQEDIAAITGRQISLMTDKESLAEYQVVAGTIGHSSLLDELITRKILHVAPVARKWEQFSITVIHRPFRNAKKLLVIAGSDRRGTAFGIFHLSRMMGVSPFTWWADIVPAKKQALFISGSYTSPAPAVQYRGIFINDEDWGLQPWAAKNIDHGIKDIGPKTYARVFELMLRLKANYIWPAMHPCTKAFYYYKDNPKVADDYAIVVGGSHCEPMLRNNVFEWAENYEQEYGSKPGEWRYDLNKEQIYRYWDDRIREAVRYESVYTVGMRGVHDGSMPGPKDPNEKLKLLQTVISDQREILYNRFAKPASAVPQIFVPYKEVLSLYRRGLQLADDVTIIWPDDNHGYIRQLPNDTERKRSGGHGVYYHLSYWGAPQDYLWLSTISPSLISYEMSKAYKYGASKLWVFNVGDIKPAELELQFAMDMAWDINKWSPERAYSYTMSWAKEIFGEKYARAIAEIKNEYYLLAASGKPEHLNAIDFSLAEIENRLKRYSLIASKTLALKSAIPAGLQDAYFQLLLYPVLAAKLMNEKILYARKSFMGAVDTKNREDFSNRSTIAFDSIQLITSIYNKEIAGGKWDGMMSWHPRDLPVFKMPLTAAKANLLQLDSLSKRYANRTIPQLVVEAIDYQSKKEAAGYIVSLVKGIGVNGKGVGLDSKSAGPSTTLNENLGYIEFQLPSTFDGDDYELVVKCLPGFAVNGPGQLRYAIAINNDKPQTINVHAEADSKEWKENVLRGYAAGMTKHFLPMGSKNRLRIYFNDPHLVINTIEFYRKPNH